jgi:hypothetical protein
VKTIYGYHIIQVTGITPAKQYTLEEVKEDVTTQLVNQEKSKVWLEWVEKTKTELGVMYKAGLEPVTTTTAPATTSTSAGQPITTVAPAATATTVPASTTITTAGAATTITTAGAATTGTAKP